MRVRSLVVTVTSAALLTLLGAGVASADSGKGGPNDYEKQWVQGGRDVGGGVAEMSDAFVSGAPELITIRTGEFLHTILN
jgi:hypothetical protein